MKKYLAEAVGTMVLVLMGCGAAVSLGCNNADPETVVGTALAFGLAVVAMAYTIGGISGCHINPAITLGVFLSGKMNSKDACGYICGQVIGAIIGSLILFILTSTSGLEGTVCARSAWCYFKDQWCHQQPRWSGYRSGFGACSPLLYPLYRYFCEPCPFYRSGSFPGWQCFG